LWGTPEISGKSTKNHIWSIKQLAWGIFCAAGNVATFVQVPILFTGGLLTFFGNTHNICESVNAFIIIQQELTPVMAGQPTPS